MAQRCVQVAAENENNVVRLQTDILIEIGRRLRVPYNEIVDEGVPARFAQLLKQLDDPVDPDAAGSEEGPRHSAEVLRLFDDSNDEGK